MKPHSIRLAEVLIFLYLGCLSAWAAPQEGQNTAALLSNLKEQGVPEEAIINIDDDGIPRVCGHGFQPAETSADGPSPLGLLPSNMRSWECIPNAIRADGVESFRLEVDANGPVIKVTCEISDTILVSESGVTNITLRDDGLNGDRAPGDYVFTSERLRYRIEKPLPATGYTNAPVGIRSDPVGAVDVLETNGVTTEFLIWPTIALLSTNIPTVPIVMLATNIQAATHVVNVVTTNRDVQRSLRSVASITSPSKTVYSVLPDAFDFLAYFSTDHIEYLPDTTADNFTVGRHFLIRSTYTGTGRLYKDIGNAYGSSNRLQGVILLDCMTRGIGSSLTAMHEAIHQWSSWTLSVLGISTGTGHYRQNCSVHSLMGGFLAAFQTNGSTVFIRRNCGSGSAHRQAALWDKYMMGLISTSAVPVLHVVTNFPGFACSGLDLLANTVQVSISNIVAYYGVRTPGPETAQRHFSIGFVAASHNRLLNATEMTFYDIWAQHFTKELPPDVTPPHLEEGWVPITRYVGEGVTWSSKGLGLIRPKITGMERLTNGFRVSGTGYPGRNYRLLATTNFVQWTTVTNIIATTNGNFVLQDYVPPQPAARWYKISTP